MSSQTRNFLWDLMVSVVFVSASAWSAHAIRGEEPGLTAAAKPLPACLSPVLHWPKAPHDNSFARERSEMPAAAVKP